MRTAPTNKKVRELISMVRERKLIQRPDFQRRLVWTRENKNHFIDSIINGYPFPEIYFADGDVDLETGEGTQLLVDGLQRVSTIIQYFEGDDSLSLTTVLPYKSLTDDEKTSFLQYDIAVRDLGNLSKEEIVEVFRRLNATKYSLLDIEINNAVYAGKLKSFCNEISENDFFKNHPIFSPLDYKRMGDLRFVLSIIGTMIQGYFNRDDAFEELLERYNDDFPSEEDIKNRIQKVIEFIEECGFSSKSRIWKKSDLFTVFIELDQLINNYKSELQPSEFIKNINNFYKNLGNPENTEIVSNLYYKSTLQASNDRLNRLRRGIIINNVIKGCPNDEIREFLMEYKLLPSEIPQLDLD